MDFDYSEKVRELRARLEEFMDRYVYPNESTYRAQLDEAESRWMIPPWWRS